MSKYSILIVDDEPNNFDVIEALLTNADYTLHYVDRGQTAITALDKFDPDVILLDVMMPDLDGFEVCQRIKMMPQWQSVPIIMVTALATKEDLARCLAVGADDFLTKPINNLELRARVNSMLRIKKQYDRIQSLSKLRQNNIYTLENSLNELRLELASDFPNELKLALNKISDCISLSHENINSMTIVEIERIFKAVQEALFDLDKLHQVFIDYVQINLAERDLKQHPSCHPKVLVQRTAILQARQLISSPKLVFDLEDPEIALTNQHWDYLVSELLSRAFYFYRSDAEMHIHGRIIDNSFHFWIDNKSIDSRAGVNSKLSELIQFDSGNRDKRELNMRLKIVKKIVEIYDGLCLIANTDRDHTTIYLALPLAQWPKLVNTGV